MSAPLDSDPFVYTARAHSKVNIHLGVEEPREDQLPFGAGEEEQQQPDEDRADRREQHRLAADGVGDRPDGQRRAQRPDRVDREDDRGRQRRQVPFLLVERVQRRGQPGDAEGQREQREQEGEGPALRVDMGRRCRDLLRQAHPCLRVYGGGSTIVEPFATVHPVRRRSNRYLRERE